MICHTGYRILTISSWEENPEMIIDMYDTNSKNINKFLKVFLKEISEIMDLQEKKELIGYLSSSVEWRRALSEKFGERPLS